MSIQNTNFKTRPGTRESETSDGSSDFKYEELHDGLSCPTCRGTGRIPRGQEDSLVALIPYSDKRLRPRRTTLYVCIAIFVSLLAAGLLIFFLFPREITITAGHVETADVKFSFNASTGDVHLWMRIQNTYNVTNNNFVRALMNSISMQAVYHNNVVGQGKTVLNKSVLPRKSLQIVSEVNVTFDGNVDEGGDLLLVSIMCDPKGHVTVHHLYLDFQVTLNTHFLAHKEEFTLASSNFSNCVKQKNNSKLLSGMFEVST